MSTEKTATADIHPIVCDEADCNEGMDSEPSDYSGSGKDGTEGEERLM